MARIEEKTTKKLSKYICCTVGYAHKWMGPRNVAGPVDASAVCIHHQTRHYRTSGPALPPAYGLVGHGKLGRKYPT